jgi:hypothetical protein
MPTSHQRVGKEQVPSFGEFPTVSPACRTGADPQGGVIVGASGFEAAVPPHSTRKALRASDRLA